MPAFEKIAAMSDIAPGGRMSVVIDETPALLLRVGDQLYAIEDVCTHDGQPLTDGPVSGTEITCPRHGAKFDLKTGKPTCMPATEPVATFEVEVRDGAVFARPRST
jgi:3-phenylpropionate/trans-cinnamate dioxygenase ferredoxin component